MQQLFALKKTEFFRKNYIFSEHCFGKCLMLTKIHEPGQHNTPLRFLRFPVAIFQDFSKATHRAALNPIEFTVALDHAVRTT
jgi:hypothetical protein